MKKTALIRWSLLITLLAMSAALVLSAWASRRDVEAWSSLLDHAEAEGLARPLFEVHAAKHRGATQPELDEIFAANRENGRRYVGEYGFDANPLVEAGEPLGPRTIDRPSRRGPRQMGHVGTRTRMTLFPPPESGFPVIVLEVEPVLSTDA